jgi:hypothetical protein
MYNSSLASTPRVSSVLRSWTRAQHGLWHQGLLLLHCFCHDVTLALLSLHQEDQLCSGHRTRAQPWLWQQVLLLVHWFLLFCDISTLVSTPRASVLRSLDQSSAWALATGSFTIALVSVSVMDSDPHGSAFIWLSWVRSIGNAHLVNVYLCFRSAALFDLGDYQTAYRDIEMALKNKYPKNLGTKCILLTSKYFSKYCLITYH